MSSEEISAVSGSPRQAHAEAADPFAKFRHLFSGFFSEAGEVSHEITTGTRRPAGMPFRSFTSDSLGGTDNVMEFSSSVYYCDEGDGAVELEVVRLGNATAPCAVQYITRDRSAVAGKKYCAAHGVLEFSPGESSKVLRIGILEDNSFDATLEFEVILSRAFNAGLGAYLHTCRVMICDNDAFPTNRFAKKLLAQKITEVPQWPLMCEFWRMNLADKTFRRRALKNIVSDQVANLNYVLSTLLMNFLIDHVLRPADGSPPPSNAAEMVYIIVSVGIAPHIILWLMDRLSMKRRIKGMVVSRLQANLLRKFLNYNEASRNVVSTSDLTMAITRDVPVLAQDGLVPCFAILQNVGLLAVLSTLAIRQMGDAIYIAIGIFLGAPISMMLFLAFRHRGTSERRQKSFRRQTELVGYLQQTIDCYRLIADYAQGPTVINAFSDKIKDCNDAGLRAALWEMTNQHFAPLMRTLICGSFILLTFQNILRGAPLGEFVTGVALCTKIGHCYEAVYKQVLRIEQAMAPLHNIVFYMNLPVDVPERMKNSRRLLEEAGKLRKLAVARKSSVVSSEEADADADADAEAREQPRTLGGLATSSENYRFTEDSMLMVGRSVTFCYPRFSGGGNWILYRANFSIAQGRLVAVTGPRLGGKATLLHLLGGIAPPTADPHGFLFIPPHLRVLHVSFEPRLISNLNLFENLCFGPSDGADEDPERVLAICRRLRMSHTTLMMVKSDCGKVSHDALIKHLYNQSAPHYKQNASKDHVDLMGTPQSVANRHMAGLSATETMLLSHTDKCILHLARALVMNPDVMVLHKPMSHFDDLQAALVLETLRNFVDNRGVETPPEGKEARRLRTCIFSTATSKYADAADTVLHVGGGSVRQVDNVALATLRSRARDLFGKLAASGTGSCTRKHFLDTFTGATWSWPMLGVSDKQIHDHPEEIEELLARSFDALDSLGVGIVDCESLTHFLHSCLDAKLFESLELLQQQGAPEGPAPESAAGGGGRWDVPPVPSETALRGPGGGSASPDPAHVVSGSPSGLPCVSTV